MTLEMIIRQLRELIDDRKALMDNDPEHDEIYVKDINALECAIDAVEFVEKSAKGEERTAHWEINCDGYYPFCSNCGEEPPAYTMTAYCPNCGAKMMKRRKEMNDDKHTS